MSKQPAEARPTTYVRPSELAKILGWRRTNVYYWLHKCKIPLVEFAGHHLIPVDDLPTVVLRLQQARADATKEKPGE